MDGKRVYQDWSTEELITEEQFLYDCEIDGEDTWFERDQVLWEIQRREGDHDGEACPHGSGIFQVADLTSAREA